MPRAVFVVTLLVVSTAAMVVSLAGEQRERRRVSAEADQAADMVALRREWAEHHRVDINAVHALGFTVVHQSPGLVIIGHTLGHCFLAPSTSAAYVEVDPALCDDVRQRDTARARLEDSLFGGLR